MLACMCVPVRRSRRARAFGTRAAALRRTGESVGPNQTSALTTGKYKQQSDKSASSSAFGF